MANMNPRDVAQRVERLQELFPSARSARIVLDPCLGHGGNVQRDIRQITYDEKTNRIVVVSEDAI